MSLRSSLESPGALLSEARHEQKRSLKSLAQCSKIPLSSLRSLEVDDWAALPSMSHARGFIKLYARELKIDPQLPLSLLSLQISERRAQARRVQKTHGKLRGRGVLRWTLGLLLLSALLTALLFQESFQAPEPKPKRISAP